MLLVGLAGSAETARKKLKRKKGAFNVGRLEVAVAATALAWLFVAAFALIVSAPTLVPILIVPGQIAERSAGFTEFEARHLTESEDEPEFSTPR